MNLTSCDNWVTGKSAPPVLNMFFGERAEKCVEARRIAANVAKLPEICGVHKAKEKAAPVEAAKL
jgi:hypothetical protein